MTTTPAAASHGPGRLLVVVYAVFALSATARSLVQLSTRWDQAPLPYLLSAVAAATYVVATVAMTRPGRRARRVAAAAVVVELVGVLTVGTLSVLDAAAFPDATVWSTFGRGYGFVPLALPFLGLAWLRHIRDR